jgi:hypothetical protein
MIQPTQEQIAELAYSIYLDEGKPEGKAEEHWRQAETLLHWCQAETLLSAKYLGDINKAKFTMGV